MPISSKILAPSEKPDAAQTCKAVFPCLFLPCSGTESNSANTASKMLRLSKSQAMCRAVFPSLSFAVLSIPLIFETVWIAADVPIEIARKNKFFPRSSFSFTSSFSFFDKVFSKRRFPFSSATCKAFFPCLSLALVFAPILRIFSTNGLFPAATVIRKGVKPSSYSFNSNMPFCFKSSSASSSLPLAIAACMGARVIL